MGVSQGALELEPGLHRPSGSEPCTQEEEEANNLVSYDSQEALQRTPALQRLSGAFQAPAGARILLLPPR